MRSKPLHLLAFVLLAALLTVSIFWIMAVTLGPGMADRDSDVVTPPPVEERPDG